MSSAELRLFALNASNTFGQKVSQKLGIPLSAHEERSFEDGEHKSRPLANVREKDVFVIQSLYSEPGQSVNDKLCRLLFFIGALKDASAKRVTAVIPYLCYAREDRRTQPRDPIITRYVANLFESVQTDRVVTMDVHNLAAFQNAFRCRTEHLEARKLFTKYFSAWVPEASEVVIVSPDAGGIKRAEQFRESLSQALGKAVTLAFMEKQRRGGIVSGDTMGGEVEGRIAIIIDDLISTGTTLVRAARACQERGACEIYAAATHGLFVEHAYQLLAESALGKVVITNTVATLRRNKDNKEVSKNKLQIIDSTLLFAEAIQCIHSGGSIVELLEEGSC